LEDLALDKYEKIGAKRIAEMGSPLGKGLTKDSAQDLGLEEFTPVGVGIIDAHAGGLGVVNFNSRLITKARSSH
jgi:D-ribulokinase